MTISVPVTLEAGRQIEVCVSSSSRPNQMVTVNVEDGDGHSDVIEVHLDTAGEGCTTWVVPPWEEVTFEDGQCDAVLRAVNPSV